MGSLNNVRQPERFSRVGSRLDTASSATVAGKELPGGVVRGRPKGVEGRVQQRA